MSDIAADLISIADASRRPDGSDSLFGQKLREAVAHVATISAGVERLKAERDAAVMEVSRQAAARGRAEGALATSETAGVVEGWRARAEAAEAEVERLKLGVRQLKEFISRREDDILSVSRRAEAAEARVAELTTERAQLSKALKWANERIGSLSVPEMEGDNLAIALCSFFDDGEPPEDETGWGPSAVEGCEQTIRAISDHYNTALAALSHTKEEGK